FFSKMLSGSLFFKSALFPFLLTAVSCFPLGNSFSGIVLAGGLALLSGLFCVIDLPGAVMVLPAGNVFALVVSRTFFFPLTGLASDLVGTESFFDVSFSS